MPVVMKLTPYYDAADFAVNIILGHGSDWQYLKAYDLDRYQGRGRIVLTADIAKAMRFADVAEAMQAWKTRSTKYPTRPDGKPNRPLTAYHATFETVD